eukprot:TRINITY_DN27704_c0_g1_i3.p1 TRINITY_DN27704_c0_g1~~TRINITY_DN27704_c0_g1_i3.p1  ORF type:complete len:400 (-),score=78.10 TRINITY_DN27704_c0_g1_i3:191-1315(-)
MVMAPAAMAAAAGADAQAGHLRSLLRLYRAGDTTPALLQRHLNGLLFEAAADDEARWEAQSRLLETVLKDDICCRRLPIPADARKRFMKEILSFLDSAGLAEVHDELFETCTRGFVVKAPGAADDQLAFSGHHVLDLPDIGCVALRVTSHIGGGLETGGRVWSSACVFIGMLYAGALQEYLRGHALELGAGTGLVGLALAHFGGSAREASSGKLRKVTLTDGVPATVDNLRYNVAATAGIVDEVSPESPRQVPVEVALLEWEADVLPEFSDPVDSIFGTDIMYNEESAQVLAKVLTRLLRPRGTAACAVVGVPERNPATQKRFHDEFEAVGLKYDRLEIPQVALDAAQPWLRIADDVRQGELLNPIAFYHLRFV